MGAESLGLLFAMTDFKASHAELGLWIMGVESGEFTDALRSHMDGYRLAIFVEDLDELLCHAHPDFLAHVDKGDRVEVLLYLNVTIRMDLGRTPLAELETTSRKSS